MCGVGWTIFYFYFGCIKKSVFNEKKKTDDDAMCGYTLLPVNQKAPVPHLLPLSETFTMDNKYYWKCKAYATSVSLWDFFCDQGVIDTGNQK